MRDYVVLGPDRELRPGSYDPPEPPEWGRDVALVRNAPNAHEAKWAAVRLWDRVDHIWSLPRENRGDGRHPLADVTAALADADDLGGGWGPYVVDLAQERVSA